MIFTASEGISNSNSNSNSNPYPNSSSAGVAPPASPDSFAIPSSPSQYNEVFKMSSEVENALIESVRTFISTNTFCGLKMKEGGDACWNKAYAPGAAIIRPSGNPVFKKDFFRLISNRDIEWLADAELVKIQLIRIFANGLAAVVVFVMDQRFKYKGVENHDRATFTMTLERGPHSWKIIHGQRSTGRPIPK